jgi:hypothetical protein
MQTFLDAMAMAKEKNDRGLTANKWHLVSSGWYSRPPCSHSCRQLFANAAIAASRIAA